MSRRIPEKDDKVILSGYGPGEIIGFYVGNKFPVHILFDSGKCVTLTLSDFRELEVVEG